MKFGKMLFILIFLLTNLFAHVNNVNLTPQAQDQNKRFFTPNVVLIERKIIDVESDEDFLKYNLTGLGTIEKPFIIENFNITNSEEFSIGNISDDNRAGIYIRNTTKNFIIQNCFLKGYYSGISIVLVKENTGIIRNNIIQAYSTGINIVESDELKCEKNYCSAKNFGISVTGSKKVQINSNYCFNSSKGIEMFFSDYTIIESNNASSNQIGIKITGSDSCNLYSNTCENNKNGIVIGNSGVLKIPEDPPPPDLKQCLLKFNLLLNNTEYGVVLEETARKCRIYDNFFVKNKKDHQAFDAGKRNKWYNYWEKEGNYWSDLGDKKTYTIDGPAGSIDRYPLNENLERTSLFSYACILSLTLVGLIITRIQRRKKK
ncbi:MAG: hypothetical protein HGN29_14950 [Asgard group archaeon]|nr:hypothetical protein [Asgard group archaeon]